MLLTLTTESETPTALAVRSPAMGARRQEGSMKCPRASVAAGPAACWQLPFS